MPKIDKASPYKYALTARFPRFTVSVEKGKEEEWEEVYLRIPNYVHTLGDLLFRLSRNNYRYAGIEMVFSQTDPRKFTAFDAQGYVLFSGEIALGLELINLYPSRMA